MDTDVERFLRSIGVHEWRGPDGGGWLTLKCPFPAHQDDSPSFRIHQTEGHYKCHGCQEKGPSVQNLAKKLGAAPVATATESPAPRAQVRQPVGELPTAKRVGDMARNLREGDDPSGLNYLHAHAITDQVIYRARVGMTEVGEIAYPVYDSDGAVVQCKFRKVNNKKKQRVIKGRGMRHVYPAHLFDAGKPVLVCAGEPDTLAAISAGQNAITSIGGEGNYKASQFKRFVHTGAGSAVWICMDNDKAGDLSRTQLARGFCEMKVQCVYMVRVPKEYNDLSDYLAAVPEDRRREHMTALMQSAEQFGEQKLDLHGMMEMDGQLISTKPSSHGDVVAPFTGRVLRHGIYRQGNADDGLRYFEIELTNKTHDKITIRHRQGAKFVESLQESPGFTPSWQILEGNADKVFTYICRVSDDTACERLDAGWVYGWVPEGDDKVDRFVGPEVVIRRGEWERNTSMVMDPAISYFNNFRLPPPPDAGGLSDCFETLLGDAYNSHVPGVMAPLMAQAILAPIRRKAMPQMPRFITFLRGRQETGKSSRALLVQNMFGDFPDVQSMLDFTSTARALQHILSQCGDSSVVIDDFKIDKLNDRSLTDHMQWMQAVQGMGRQRMHHSGKHLNQAPPAHCLPVVTLEAMPTSDASLLGRSLVIEITPNPLRLKRDNVRYGRAMDSRDRLPFITSAWIQHISGDIDFCNYYRSSRDQVKSRVHEAMGIDHEIPNLHRLTDRLTDLTFVWMMFLKWSRNYAQESVVQQIITDWWDDVLPNLAKDNAGVAVDAGQASEFVDMILAGLSAGSAYFRHPDGKTLPKWASHNASCIGWVRDGKFWLTTSVAKLDERKRRWQELKPFLVDNQVIEKASSRLTVANRATCYLIASEHQRELRLFLEALDNPNSAAGSSGA